MNSRLHPECLASCPASLRSRDALVHSLTVHSLTVRNLTVHSEHIRFAPRQRPSLRPVAATLALVVAVIVPGAGRAVAVEPADEEPEVATVADADGTAVSFYREVRPIFQAKCHGCHQPAKAMGEYEMTVMQSLLAGGESGETAIVPGQPDDSYLVSLVTPVDGQAEMPRKGDPLSGGEVELIRRWIATGARDDTPNSTKEVYNSDNPPRYSRPPVITSLDFSPDGELLAVAGFHEVRLHAIDGALVARLIGLSERIESVRFSPDGSKLAVTGGLPGRTGEVQVWDVASRELLLSLPVTYDTVYGASWSPDGTMIAFGCSDNSVRAVDAESGEQLFYQGSHNDWVFDTVFSADGDHLISVGRDMTAKLSEVPTERFIDNITSITPGALKGGIACVVRHPLRDEVLFGGADGIPKIYQMHRTTERKIGDDANLLWELPALPGRVFSVAISSDARRIAAGSSLNGEGTVAIFGMAAEPDIPEDIRGILQTPTHSRKDRERTKLRDHFAAHVQLIAKLPMATGGIYAVAIHPDNRRVAAAGTDGQIYYFEAETGAALGSFQPVEIDDDVATLVTSTEVEQSQLAAISGAEAASAADDEVAAALAGDVVQIDAEPSSIALVRATDAVQLVITATRNDGSRVDITRLVQYRPTAPLVSVSANGRVEPLAEGSGELVLQLGQVSVAVPMTVANVDQPLLANFIRDVGPVLSRAGCNGGTCHGAKDGKNGFKLSLRGYDPLMDVRSFTDDLSSRRVNLAAPDQSLMLLKSTGAVPHEGGQVIKPASDYYQVIRSWIDAGATLDLTTPRVTQIDVHPINPVIYDLGGQQQMRVVATFADGVTRDVTSEAFIESGNTEVAATVPRRPGLLTAIRRGEAPVLVRYEGNYVGTTVTVMGDRTGFEWVEPPANNPVDKFVAEKLRRTKTLPSPLCNDYEFVRRVHLDLTGLPPSSDAVRNFIADERDSRWKREDLIDQLLVSDAFIDHWTNKWADLLQVNGRFLGRDGATSLRAWIRERIADNQPYDTFSREILTASGSNKENPAASYFKILRTPQDAMENTTHLFLATRFNCNKCHDHPFERWTQDQYYELAAFFAHVDRKADPAAEGETIGETAVEEGKPLYEIVFEKPSGEVIHDRTGLETAPKFPYEVDFDADQQASRREQLAAWITSRDNPYFATSYVNRVWGYLTGTGLIEPLDDIRAGNPPSNPELLTWLTDRFVASGFDVRQLIRTICRSRTYQLSITTNRWNEDDTINFSHAKARRLPAEVLYDAIYHATGTMSDFPDVEPGTRASALPDVGIRLADGFLANLGRPPRESACECERSNQLQLGPIMALVSGPTVGKAVSDHENAIAKLVAEFADDRSLVEELFMRILNRPPSQTEMDAALSTAANMEQEHALLTQELDSFEVQAARILHEQEAQRLAALEAARQDLADYEAEIAPQVARREQRRVEKIAQLRVDIDDRRRQLLDAQREWELAQDNPTVWTPLDPKYYFIAEQELILTRNDDLSFSVAGSSMTQDYRFEAPTPLAGITGLRLDALADPELPKFGPGKSEDGDFLLTEIEVATRQRPDQDLVLLHRWDFAADVGELTWTGDRQLTAADGLLRVIIEEEESAQLILPVSDAEGGFALDIVAKLPRSIGLLLGWTTPDEIRFDDDSDRVERQGLVAQDGQWNRYRLFFDSEDELTGIVLVFRTHDVEIEIDSISLFRHDAPEFEDVALENAQADFSQEDHDVAQAIDGVDAQETGWAIQPRTGVNHVAVFETKTDVAGGDDGELHVVLRHQSSAIDRSLGRLRLSVTSSPRPISIGLPQDIMHIVGIDPNERSEEQQETLRKFYLDGDTQLASQRYLLAKTEQPLPTDEGLVARRATIERLERPTPVDPKLLRMRNHVQLSAQQLGRRRLTAAQDIAWALINSPAFLYNH